MIDLQPASCTVAFFEVRGLHLACSIQHKGALELEPHIYVRMRRGLRGAAMYIYRYIDEVSRIASVGLAQARPN